MSIDIPVFKLRFSFGKQHRSQLEDISWAIMPLKLLNQEQGMKKVEPMVLTLECGPRWRVWNGQKLPWNYWNSLTKKAEKTVNTLLMLLQEQSAGPALAFEPRSWPSWQRLLTPRIQQGLLQHSIMKGGPEPRSQCHSHWCLAENMSHSLESTNHTLSPNLDIPWPGWIWPLRCSMVLFKTKEDKMLLEPRNTLASPGGPQQLLMESAWAMTQTPHFNFWSATNWETLSQVHHPLPSFPISCIYKVQIIWYGDVVAILKVCKRKGLWKHPVQLSVWQYVDASFEQFALLSKNKGC